MDNEVDIDTVMKNAALSLVLAIAESWAEEHEISNYDAETAREVFDAVKLLRGDL